MKGASMRKNKQILLTLFVTLALVALAWFAGQGRVSEPLKTVLAAQCDISAGSQITADQLVQIQIPAEMQVDCYVTDIEEAVGLWSTVNLMKGELLSGQRLTGSASGLTYPDPGPGRRLMTIRLEAADANGFWLTAGNHVDIFLIPRRRDDGSEIQILENVRIMEIIGGENNNGSFAAASKDPLVCLDLNIDQARLINGAQGLYDLRLAVINEPAKETIRRQGPTGLTS
jgi:Flp pilus assembly protein CpaB